MKKRFQLNYKITSLIFALILAIGAGEIRAQVCASAPGNLVSWYTGENNALDSRGGNHLTPQNGAGYAAGQVGRAFNFDGTDDYYSAPSVPANNFGTGDFTVEYWIRINGAQLSAGREYGLINKNATYQGNPGWGFELSTEFGNFPNPRIDFFNTISIWNSTNVRATITTDVWHHVVGLRENGVNKLYLDGVLAQINNNTNAAANVANNQPLLVGSWLGTYFPGHLDEISLYNRALSPAEIQAIFNAGNAGKCPTSTPVSIGLAEWWTADGSVLGVRHRIDGTLQNGASFGNGKVGQAFSFDGTDDAFNVPDAPQLNPVAQITVEAWVFPTAASGGPDSSGVILSKEQIVAGVGGVVQYALARKNEVPCSSGTGIPNGNFQFYLDGVLANGCDGWIDGNAPLPVGVWTHIAVTYDGSFVRAYVNGIQTRTFGETGAISVTNGDLRIGARDADLTQGFFAGRVDEPAVYNRALSANEIQAIFNAGSAGKSKPTAVTAPANQVLWLAGDGNTNDISGGGNNGTLQNGARHVVGKVGQGFSFDGVDDYLQIASSGIFRNQAEATIEAWIKPQGSHGEGQGAVFFEDTSVGNITRFGVFVANDGSVRVIGRDAFTGNAGVAKFTDAPAGSAPLNTWTHVAGIWQSGIGIKLYVNGILAASLSDVTLTNFTADNAQVVRSGSSGTASVATNTFNGSLDEVSLYNRALTADEIASIFNAGQAGKLKETVTSGTTATVGDVTLTFPNAATRTVQQIPLDKTDFPELPMGMISTGLFYDIATDVLPAGTTDLCFNLPSFAALSASEFNERSILHLENGAWTDRTLSRDFATKTICARAPSLSPFAIVDSNLAPTAALLSITGRITNAKGTPIARVRVLLTDANGATRDVVTNTFGYYRFDEVPAGQTYILSVNHKRYQFSPESQIITLQDAAEDVDFMAIE